jgi:hypothetical protein
MSNGTDQMYNCASEVCCDNGDADKPKRIAAWVALLTKAMGPGPYTPTQVGEYIDETWDVAGKGTLYDFKEWVVKTFTDSHQLHD